MCVSSHACITVAHFRIRPKLKDALKWESAKRRKNKWIACESARTTRCSLCRHETKFEHSGVVVTRKRYSHLVHSSSRFPGSACIERPPEYLPTYTTQNENLDTRERQQFQISLTRFSVEPGGQRFQDTRQFGCHGFRSWSNHGRSISQVKCPKRDQTG